MVCHVYGDGNNESSKLFWSIQKGKVEMINNSTPIPNVISYTDKTMRRINRIATGKTRIETF